MHAMEERHLNDEQMEAIWSMLNAYLRASKLPYRDQYTENYYSVVIYPNGDYAFHKKKETDETWFYIVAYKISVLLFPLKKGITDEEPADENGLLELLEEVTDFVYRERLRKLKEEVKEGRALRAQRNVCNIM